MGKGLQQRQLLHLVCLGPFSKKENLAHLLFEMLHIYFMLQIGWWLCSVLWYHNINATSCPSALSTEDTHAHYCTPVHTTKVTPLNIFFHHYQQMWTVSLGFTCLICYNHKMNYQEQEQ